MLLNLFHQLTAHEAQCYFVNYPDRAKWYVNNHKDIHNLKYAIHNYDLVVTKLHEHPNVNCVLPSDGHVKVLKSIMAPPPLLGST